MEHVKSKDILLSVNIGTEAAPEWKKLGCSTSKGFSLTTDSVSIATDCNGGFTSNKPGDSSWSFDESAYVPKNADSSYLTEDELFEITANKEIHQWKLESIDPDFTYLRQGNGWISDLGETTDAGDYLQRSVTITGDGEVTNVQLT